MPLLRNPLIEEAFAYRFFSRLVILLVAAHLVLHFVVLLLLWPRAIQSESILFGDTPSAFRVIVVLSYLCLSLFNGVLGTEPFSKNRGYHNSEWLRLGAVPLKTFFAGKITVSFLHALLIVLLTLPFLLLSGAVSGVRIPTVLVAAAAILAFTFTYRITALGLRLFLERRRFSLALLLSLFLILMMFGTAAVYPPLNPIFALSRMDAEQTLLVTNMAPRTLADPRGLAQAFAVHAAAFALSLALGLLKARQIRRESAPKGRSRHAPR